MIDKIENTLKTHKMLNDTKKVLVGFSGGADSAALLYFLRFYGQVHGFEVIAVHINHGLRAEESERDERFAVSFCETLGIDIIVKKEDVKKISQDLKVGVEEAGRYVRYKVFEILSSEFGVKVATAHTLSDNAETILMNLARGTSLKGMCGIPPVRGNIIRPLINVTRAEIEEYCLKNHITYINDSSNYSKDYTRNKIRLDIIPLFKTINPSFESAVGRCISSFIKDESYLNFLMLDALKAVKCGECYDCAGINDLNDSVKYRVIAHIIKNFTEKSPEQKHIILTEKIIKAMNGKVNLANNTVVECENGFLRLKKQEQKTQGSPECQIQRVNTLTEIQTTIIIDTIPIEEYNKIKINSNNCFRWALDFQKIPPGSVFRTRRPGDICVFLKRKINKSLKKFLNELKIPREQRERLAVLAYENQVIWMDGIGVFENYAVGNNTKTVAVITKE